MILINIDDSGRKVSSCPVSTLDREPRPATFRRMHVPAIHFLDVTNRDGVQTARTGLSKFGKTMVNFYL